LIDLNEVACEMLVLLRSEAMNLMLNAIEAMNEIGGELTVRSEQSRPVMIKCGSRSGTPVWGFQPTK
jgi:hypothetical protein